MNGYLLDTSICVALFRGNRDVANHLNRVGERSCYINDVVVAELLAGAYNSSRVEENIRQVNSFISAVQVIPFADTVHEFAKERVRLRGMGNRIEDFDLAIGAAAKAKGLTMVTHNVKHFERIEGLVIEDWVK